MTTVEEGIQSQLRNIEKAYGKTIDELAKVISDSGLEKHNEVVSMLKQRYGMAHAAAHRVSLTARNRTAPRAATGSGVAAPLQDVYELLLDKVAQLGDDIERSPKKGYVSLRRRKQFAMVQPGAKWINVGLILADDPPGGRLESASKWNALFTHRVRVATATDVDNQLVAWLRKAYDAAG